MRRMQPALMSLHPNTCIPATKSHPPLTLSDVHVRLAAGCIQRLHTPIARRTDPLQCTSSAHGSPLQYILSTRIPAAVHHQYT